MKVRIKGNSIRYRLTKSDLEKLKDMGIVKEITYFPSKTFTYSLKLAEVLNLQADFQNDEISILFPKKEMDLWFNSERVGYDFTTEITPEKSLKILVEKDFVCIDAVDEDQSDNFPNPNLTC